jgi:electron transfer flavoprotein beta subunit
MKLDIEGTKILLSREIEGGKEYIETSLPAVIACQEPIAEWKIPNMRGIMTARTKPLTVLPAFETNVLTETIKYSLPKAKQGCHFIPASEAETLIHLLKTEAKVL